MSPKFILTLGGFAWGETKAYGARLSPPMPISFNIYILYRPTILQFLRLNVEVEVKIQGWFPNDCYRLLNTKRENIVGY
jgi:hypothetical protein